MANKLITKSNEWLTHIMKYYDNKISISKGMNKRNCLFVGLDISTSSTGYCMIDSNKELKKLGVITPNKESSVFEMANSICNKLDDEILTENEIQHKICIEDFMRHFSGNNWTTQNLFKLCQINGIVHYHCMKKLNCSVFQIHPSVPRHFFHLITQKNPSSDYKSNKISVIKQNGFNFVSSLIPSFDWPKNKNGEYKNSCYDMSDSYILSLYSYYMNNFEELMNDNSFYNEMKELYKEKQTKRLEKLKSSMKEEEYEKYLNEKIREKLLLEYNKYIMEKDQYNEIIKRILPEDVNQDNVSDESSIAKESQLKFIEQFKSKTITKSNSKEKIDKKKKERKIRVSDNIMKEEVKESVNKPKKQYKNKTDSNKQKLAKKSFVSRKTVHHKVYKRSFHTSILTLDNEKDMFNEILNTNISLTDEDLKSIKAISEKMYGNEDEIFNEVMNEYPSSLGLTDEEKEELMRELNQKVVEKYGINGDLNSKSNDEIAKDINEDLEKLENEEDRKVLEKLKNGESIGNYDRLLNKYHKPKK